MDFLHAVLNDWVEKNFDDVEEVGDHRLRKSGRILGDSGRNLRDGRSRRDSHRRPVDDRLQMNRHSRIVFWSGLDSKNENIDVPDKKVLDRIAEHEMVSTHREDLHAYRRSLTR